MVTYLYRDFPEDHPPLFNFRDEESGELISFMLEQLTELERRGAIEYLSVTTLPPEAK